MSKVEVGKFNLDAAMRGYDLNRMCHSLNYAGNRQTFAESPARYCALYGLDEEETAAVVARDRQRLYALGGNMYYLAKLDRVKTTETQ